MLDYLEEYYQVLGTKEFLEEVKKGNNDEDKICLTFDDGVMSQYGIAAKILEKRGLTGFFFVYTSHFDGEPSVLEICHDFRFRMYDNVNLFYQHFFLY